MSLVNRVEKLEEEIDAEACGPSLEQRLREVLEEARERRRQGIPAPPPPEGDSLIAQRLRRALERADMLRRL